MAREIGRGEETKEQPGARVRHAGRGDRTSLMAQDDFTPGLISLESLEPWATYRDPTCGGDTQRVSGRSARW